uniref:Uncharacterized protein n=1 Tax=Trichogramma kaykai TaxID=54128 RepID=A0ABD2WC15_9HYME
MLYIARRVEPDLHPWWSPALHLATRSEQYEDATKRAEGRRGCTRIRPARPSEMAPIHLQTISRAEAVQLSIQQAELRRDMLYICCQRTCVVCKTDDRCKSHSLYVWSLPRLLRDDVSFSSRTVMIHPKNFIFSTKYILCSRARLAATRTIPIRLILGINREVARRSAEHDKRACNRPAMPELPIPVSVYATIEHE